MSDPTEDDADVWPLIDALLDGRSTPDGRRQLHDWVTTRPDVARLYARAAHQWAVLPRNVQRPQDPAALLARLTADAAGQLDETMILPAVRDTEWASVQDDDATGVAPPSVFGRRPARRPWAGLAALASLATAAAVVLVVTRHHPGRPAAPRAAPAPAVAVAVVPPPTPAGPVRAAVVRAAAGASWDLPVPAAPGTVLTAGQSFELSRGGVEIAFDSGSVAVVAAPARVRVVDRNRMELAAGSLTAHVPPPAVGFGVAAPGLSVVDRGTDFGVRAAAGTDTEVAVFTGAVDAAALDAAAVGRGEGARPVRVTAGHAAAHAAGGTAPPAVAPYDPAPYLRDIADLRMPVPCHGTGEGLQPGTVDPAWQVVGVPGRPDGGPPLPLYVARVDAARVAANRPDANWVAVTPDMTQEATAGEYRLRTTLDLTGFDPATATVTAGLVGDGQVTDVRVNGTGTGPRNPPLGNRSPRSGPRPWTLEGAPWHAGPNDVVVVLQKTAGTRGKVGPLGLQLSWTATARPTVRR